MEEWIKEYRALLEMEVTEEATALSDRIATLSAKACENEGLSIVNLEVLATRTELFGRCCVEFQKIGKAALPTSFKVGDEVSIIPANTRSTAIIATRKGDEDDESEIFGLIKSTGQFSIEVVLDEYDDRLIDFPLRLNLRPSMKTHVKMMEVLTSMVQSPHPLLSMLYRSQNTFDKRGLTIGSTKVNSWYNEGLNESQKQAVETCLNASLVSIVHGPPGTGKTSTLTELLMQTLERRQKVLVCAPSNIAVDTILMRLVEMLSRNKNGKSTTQINLEQFRNQIIRLGHPARVSSGILDFTLDSHIDHDEGTDIVNDIRKEMQELRTKLQNPRSFKSKDGSNQMNRREVRSELRSIKKEAISREKSIVERLVRNASIVFSTCVGASSYLLKEIEFDLVVVDEAAQALEAACWIPLVKSQKCVLAGDHCQLPPTIKSKIAEQGGLNKTLFEKIINDQRFSSIVTLLNVQYRMNDIISRWASKNMYNNNVLSAANVANHSIKDLLPQQDIKFEDSSDDPERSVMLMIDTSDCFMYEDSSDGTSHRNINEADIVLQHAIYLLQLGITPSCIGVITPYNGQLELLRDLFSTAAVSDPCNSNLSLSSKVTSQLSAIDIKTIDGFQGGEKECIIISLVRSNDQHTVGFLGENRRLNVAVTRAKRQVTIVCDSSTCSTNSFINTLIEHVHDNGEIIPADVYLDQHTFIQSKSTKSINNVNSSKSIKLVDEKDRSKQLKKGGSSKSSKVAPANVSNVAAIGGSQKSQSCSGSKSSKELDPLCLKINAMISNFVEGKVPCGVVDSEITNVSVQDANSMSLLFPSSLSSFHRMYVHQIAEERGLIHTSHGEGSERRISVSLKLNVSNGSNSQAKQDILDTIQKESKSTILKESSSSDDEDVVNNFRDHSPVCADSITSQLESESLSSVSSANQVEKVGKAKGKKKNTKSNDSSMDEDEFLNTLVQQNMKLAELHKYRIGAKPIPNYEKEISKQKLKSKLAEAQAARRPISSTSEKDTSSSSSSSSSRNKVVKKPVPNFGGGKVGTG